MKKLIKPNLVVLSYATSGKKCDVAPLPAQLTALQRRVGALGSSQQQQQHQHQHQQQHQTTK